MQAQSLETTSSHYQSLGRWRDVYKIVLYRLKKDARYLQFYVRGDDTAARAVKLVGTDGETLRVAPMSDRRIKISDSNSRIDAWRGTRSLERR